MVTGAKKELVRRASDIASAHGRSRPFRAALAKLIELTDGLLVLALQAVEEAAAAALNDAGPTEQTRILAWLVADAMGAMHARHVC